MKMRTTLFMAALLTLVSTAIAQRDTTGRRDAGRSDTSRRLLPGHSDTTAITVLDSVRVRTSVPSFGITRLKDVDGAGIYAGKKSEVIVLKDITANTSTNNTRQIYSKIAGLNIYENDGGAGIQLAIGGRGLDPNRVSNFNTRQNGYDISADALGYPESYYTPPAEALERIEIVRGASSLQYGTQFGGILNFRLNGGPDSAKMQIVARESTGSWGFFNTSTSIGGTSGKWKYYVFYQHKSGLGWRPNSRFNVNTAYAATTWKPVSRLSITAQYTHMDYLEQQPGGLNDDMFAQDPRQITKARNWFKVNWNLGAVLLDYNISTHLQFNSRFFGLLASRSALGIINTVVDPGGPRQYRTDNYTNWGNESRLVYTYNARSDHPFVLLGGIRYYHGYTDRKIGNGNDGSGGAKSDFAFSYASVIDSLSYSRYKFPNHNTALFMENIFRLTSKLSLIPGVRYEHIVTKSDGFYNSYIQDYAGNIIYNQLVAENRTSKRSFVIGGLGLSYNAGSDVQWYANISQNYRAINFNDMSIVNPNYRVDPNLKDEKGYSADIGIRGRHMDIVNYDVSVFTIDYNNRIGTILLKDTTSPNTYQYTTNISKSRNWGVESFVEVDIWKLINGSGAKMKLSVFSNFSLIDAKYAGSKESAYQNKKVEFVPDVIFRSGINFRKGRLAATYQYAYTGRQFSDATNSITPSNNGINGMLPSYYVMDLSADFRISRIFSVSGTINNLSNHIYYTRRADSYPGPGIVPADARGFYGTLQVKL
jgi:Fe(3+) dicitrate transport protein